MKQFIIEGGRIYMIILIALFLLVLGLSIYAAIMAFGKADSRKARIDLLMGHIRSVALFALAFAVFSQIMGLVDIFNYLAGQDAGVSSSVLVRGIKITFHPTLVGLIIYLFAILTTMILRVRIRPLSG